MSFLNEAAAAERRAVIAQSPVLLAAGERLSRLLDPLRSGPLPLPGQKPLLSRAGGVCPDDGARLLFDPIRRDAHECPSCGAVHRGTLHDRAWSWRFHLWHTERAIHAAVLQALGFNDDGFDLAAGILTAYTERYTSYPNRDNVLGPSRMFFSTYLESIWLLQITTAAEVIRSNAPDRWASLEDPLSMIIQQSSTLIRSFDEGWSNRQVWNNAAMIAAGDFLGDDELYGGALHGPHGLQTALETVVSEDGRWVEGENYHFFALHGFQYIHELIRMGDRSLFGGVAGKRFQAMFAAPLQTLLPDLTFPARGDSPYGVSVAQPRFAELWEVARARFPDDRLGAVLAAVYAQPGDHPDHGFRELAEVETPRPPGGVKRDALGWKMLCFGSPELPGTVEAWSRESVSVPPVVIRGADDRYVSVETGTGAGHGHPDALHLTLFDGTAWFADFGTASYLTPSLFWYRSSLAHNAPTAPGRGQAQPRGRCVAVDQVQGYAWCAVEVPEIFGPGTAAVRTVVVAPEYVLDLMTLSGPADMIADLPLHPLGVLADLSGEPVSLEQFSQPVPKQGYDALAQVRRLSPPPGRLVVQGSAQPWDIVLMPGPQEVMFTAVAPGPPTLSFADGAATTFLVRRVTGPGAVAALYARAGVAAEVQASGGSYQVNGAGFADDIRLSQGRAEIHRAGAAPVTLQGVQPAVRRAVAEPPLVPHMWCPMISRALSARDCFERLPWNAIHKLRAEHYRRSEASYPGEDAFSARVSVWVSGARLCIAVQVRKPEIVRYRARESEPLDNEPPEIHADGAQIYWSDPETPGRWNGVVVALTDDTPVIRPVTSTTPELGAVDARTFVEPEGYRLLVTVEQAGRYRAGDQFRFNVVINEMRPGRERRAGQLAFVGGGGWVYLRGDREPMSTSAVAEVK